VNSRVILFGNIDLDLSEIKETLNGLMIDRLAVDCIGMIGNNNLWHIDSLSRPQALNVLCWELDFR